MQQKAHAVSDASMKDGRIGSCLFITDEKKQKMMHNTLFHKSWSNNTVKGAEAIMLLELVTVLYKRSKSIALAKTTIAVDNWKKHRGLVDETCKVSYFFQDAGAEIAQIRKLVKETQYKIEFELANNND